MPMCHMTCPMKTPVQRLHANRFAHHAPSDTHRHAHSFQRLIGGAQLVPELLFAVGEALVLLNDVQVAARCRVSMRGAAPYSCLQVLQQNSAGDHPEILGKTRATFEALSTEHRKSRVGLGSHCARAGLGRRPPRRARAGHRVSLKRS